MTIDTIPIAVGQPVLRSTILAMAQQLNSLTNHQRFLASGSFSVPNGVHRLRVGLCGAGGEFQYMPGGSGDATVIDGSDAEWVVKEFDVEEGQTFTVTINPSSTSFGSVLTSYSILQSGNYNDHTPSVGADYRGVHRLWFHSDTNVGGTGYHYYQKYGGGARYLGNRVVADLGGPIVSSLLVVPAGAGACLVEW